MQQKPEAATKTLEGNVSPLKGFKLSLEGNAVPLKGNGSPLEGFHIPLEGNAVPSKAMRGRLKDSPLRLKEMPIRLKEMRRRLKEMRCRLKGFAFRLREMRCRLKDTASRFMGFGLCGGKPVLCVQQLWKALTVFQISQYTTSISFMSGPYRFRPWCQKLNGNTEAKVSVRVVEIHNDIFGLLNSDENVYAVHIRFAQCKLCKRSLMDRRTSGSYMVLHRSSLAILIFQFCRYYLTKKIIKCFMHVIIRHHLSHHHFTHSIYLPLIVNYC